MEKGLALRIEYWVGLALYERLRIIAENIKYCTFDAHAVAQLTRVNRLISQYMKQSSQNCGGQGESDCLIKTKHCETPKGY